MFKDKVYEDMDDVEKIFEPFQYKLNDELAEFPDKIKVEIDEIMKEDYWSGFGIDIDDVVRKRANKLGLRQIVSEAYNLVYADFFKFEFEDKEENEKVTLDPVAKTMSHDIYLVKSKIAYDELELETMRVETLRKLLMSAFNRRVSKPRLNEIADIYGANDVKSERSRAGKVQKLISHLEEMIKSKVLDIRDMDLHIGFIQWIVLYVRDGNLAALNNLTRIKIITHEKRPIYSIEEKEVR